MSRRRDLERKVASIRWVRERRGFGVARLNQVKHSPQNGRSEHDRMVNGDDGLAVFEIQRIDVLRDSTNDSWHKDATGYEDSADFAAG
jgi:hypothetical protein